MNKEFFYDVHVFFSREDGYSIPVKITGSNVLTEDEVIAYAAANNMFTDDGDQHHVDYVTEIDEDDYLAMGGK